MPALSSSPSPGSPPPPASPPSPACATSHDSAPPPRSSPRSPTSHSATSSTAQTSTMQPLTPSCWLRLRSFLPPPPLPSSVVAPASTDAAGHSQSGSSRPPNRHWSPPSPLPSSPTISTPPTNSQRPLSAPPSP